LDFFGVAVAHFRIVNFELGNLIELQVLNGVFSLGVVEAADI
jgi:hypothetical protein